MTEEEKDKNQNSEPKPKEEAQKPKAKSGLVKYIIFGVGGLVLVLIVAFGVAFLMAKKTNSTANQNNQEVATTQNSEKAKPSSPKAAGEADSNMADTPNDVADSNMALTEDDKSAIQKIEENLKFLDYQPNDSELKNDNSKMAVEDSVKEMNWIEKEKAKLAEKEKELNKREKQLDKKEREINSKLVQVDQAESARITKLANLYDGMDPRAVAQLMSNLDDKTIVAIIPRMKPKNASSVLQLIPSKRAAQLSKRMISIAEK